MNTATASAIRVSSMTKPTGASASDTAGAGAVCHDDILTVNEVAQILKCRPASVYNMTRKRGIARYAHPLPVLRLPLGLRFRRSSIMRWIEEVEERPQRRL